MTRYVIRDHRGEIVAFHDRHDEADGGKRFTWSRPDGQLGLGGMGVADLPLFGAQRASSWSVDSPVIVVEGEKAARSLVDAGWQAVGTVTGASSCPSRASLSILMAHDILLWPDADDAGRSHMAKVAATIGPPGEIVASLRQIDWPDAPPGGDAADFLAAGGDVEALVRAALPFHADRMEMQHRTGAHGARSALPVSGPPSTITAFNAAVTVTEVLRREFGLEARPGRAVRCPLHDDRSPSLSVLADDRRVFCHSPSCVLHDGGRGADAWALANLATRAVPA